MVNINDKVWRWAQVAEWLASTEPQLGAEIGVKEGRFVDYMLQTFPELTMYAIDPRCVQEEGTETYLDWDWQAINSEYAQRIKGKEDRVIEVKSFSLLAAQSVPDESLDFVFLDAQHDYESVKRGIAAWQPKLKKGGLMSGHDYDPNPIRNYGVIPAVNEAYGKGNIMKGRNYTWGIWL